MTTINRVAKSTDSGAKLPKFKSWLLAPLLTSCVTYGSLYNFGFLICKIGTEQYSLQRLVLRS